MIPHLGSPAPHDEREFTPWAEPGWTAWNSYSAEAEVCHFLGTLQRFIRPAVVLETGAGGGRVTEHLHLDGVDYRGFESDADWRDAHHQDAPSPSAADMAAADMVILDSSPEWRTVEVALWGEHGRPGSLCFVHDCGNDHPAHYTNHHRNRRAVEALGIPGVWLKNPRGAWMGVHP